MPLPPIIEGKMQAIQEKIDTGAYEEEIINDIEQIVSELASQEMEAAIIKATTTCYLNLIICCSHLYDEEPSQRDFAVWSARAKQAAEKALQASEGLMPDSDLAQLFRAAADAFYSELEIDPDEQEYFAVVEQLYERGLQLLEEGEKTNKIAYYLEFALLCFKQDENDKGLTLLQEAFAATQTIPGIIDYPVLKKRFEDIYHYFLDTQGWEIAERFYKPANDLATLHGDVAISVKFQLALNLCYASGGKFAEAEEAAALACEQAQKLVINKFLLDQFIAVVEELMNNDCCEMAERLCKQVLALEQVSQLSGQNAVATVQLQLALSLCYMDRNEFPAAQEATRQACEQAQKIWPWIDQPLVGKFVVVVEKFMRNNFHEVAGDFSRQILSFVLKHISNLKRPVESYGDAIVELCVHFSACLLNLGEPAESEKAARQALQVYRKLHYSPKLTQLLVHLASEFCKRKQYKFVEQLLPQLIGSLEQQLEKQEKSSTSAVSAQLCEAYYNLGVSYYNSISLGSADGYFRKTIAIIFETDYPIVIKIKRLTKAYSYLSKPYRPITGMQSLYQFAKKTFAGNPDINMQAFKSIYDTLLQAPATPLPQPQYHAAIKNLQQFMRLVLSCFQADALPSSEISQFLQNKDNLQQFMAWEAALNQRVASLQQLTEDHPSFGMAVTDRLDQHAQKFNELEKDIAELRAEIAVLREENRQLREENQQLKREPSVMAEPGRASKKQRVESRFFSSASGEASGTIVATPAPSQDPSHQITQPVTTDFSAPQQP